MANPVFVNCPSGAWTKVATAISSGRIWRASTAPSKYLHTYRDTGGAAPTASSEGMPIFVDTEQDVEPVSASAPIDLYIFPIGGAGRVRVDM